MALLYWACDAARLEELLHRAKSLREDSKVVGRGNGSPVIQIRNPDPRLLRETMRLIWRRQLVSAAAVKEQLSPDEFFIAAEWVSKFVVARSELGMVEAIGSWLEHETDFARRDLAIFAGGRGRGARRARAGWPAACRDRDGAR